LPKKPEVELRRARPDDAATILRWRNDPWIVSLGKGGRTVSPDEHAAWMKRVLASPDHVLFVVQVGGADAGLVRLDRIEGAAALVTIYLMQPFIGKGHGSSALRAAVSAGFKAWPDLRALHAEVRRDNAASLRLFARCGFTQLGTDDELVQFRLARSDA
jgi:RimJ/RimL family protein N-acetyltransferase